MEPRTILHADLDAFYAAIEQRDAPELRGKPVIVGGLGRRGVVATASYEARRFGVHSAQPTAVARRLCPQGVFLPPRMDVYAREAERLRAIFATLTPLVEPLSLDEAFLDVTGCEALLGQGPAVAALLKARVRAELGLTVSVGVAASKFVAKVASDLRKPDGLVVVPAGTERAFLAPLPVRRLWGVGPVTQRRLEAVGLATIAAVQVASRERLVATLGEALGEHLWLLAQGVDPRPVEPARDAHSVSHEVTFEVDLLERAACHAVLLELAEAVGRRLRREHLVGRVVRLKVRFPPFVTHTRQRRLDAPVADDLVLHRTAVALLDALVPRPRPIRLLGVGISELAREGAAAQGGLFGSGVKGRRALAAMDAIRDRFGEGAIAHGAVRRSSEGAGGAGGDART